MSRKGHGFGRKVKPLAAGFPFLVASIIRWQFLHMRYVLLGLVLFSVLPGSASALTMLDPGGSAVNPIYVQDVTPSQLRAPAEAPTYFDLHRQRIAPIQPLAPQTPPPPTVIYVNNPVPALSSCPVGYLSVNGSCLTYNQSCQQKYGSNTYGDATSCYCSDGYEWNGSNTACIQTASSIEAGGGSGPSTVISCDRMVIGKMTHLGYATPSECDAKQDAAIEAYYETPAVTQPVAKAKAVAPVSAPIAAVAASVTSTTSVPSKQPTYNWWQKFLMWLGGL